MANITTSGTSDYPASTDSYTAVSDVVTEIVAAHYNGLAAAVIAIETELGTGLKGTTASLATRLSQLLATDGGLRSGTSFPVASVATLFWRTDLKELYVYNPTSGQWQRVDSTNDHGLLSGLSDDDHTQYALANGSRDFTGHVTTSDNLRFKSGTSFLGVFDHAITADRTWTLPNATTTLVGDNTTQTLTGKTLSAPTLTGTWGGGTMGSGTVPLARFQRTEVANSNSGLVTVLGTATDIVTANLGTVENGDRVFVYGYCLMTKGATGGYTILTLDKSAGTATGTFMTNRSDMSNEWHSHTAGVTSGLVINGMYRVSGSGTLTLRLKGVSGGSDSTVSANEGNLVCWVIRAN